MYPMLLNPVLKSDIWGGTKLITEFGFVTQKPTVSQAIMLSGRENSSITVKNGSLAGQKLQDILPFGKDIAVEIKLVDACDRTSIKTSLCKDGPLFNTDTLLYITDCEEGAEIIYGLYQDISLAEFERAVNLNQISKFCNFVKVNKGDFFVIPSKTVWAIGKGVVALQISPSSSKEYRIYDYGRKDADNKPRKLYLNSVASHICTAKNNLPYGNIGEMTLYPFGTVRELFVCEKFGCQMLNIDGMFGAYEKNSFISIVVTDGAATVSYPSGNIHIKKGDSLLIPKDTRIKITGKAQFLYTNI